MFSNGYSIQHMKVKIYLFENKYHVITMTESGKVIHEKFRTEAQALEFVKEFKGAKVKTEFIR